MRDIENPMIEQIERTGYPDKEYLDFERQEETEEEGECLGKQGTNDF